MRWFMNPSARVSAHYVVGRDGEIVQMVHEHEKAWHAGQALLYGDPNVNSMSIGIELVNWGELQRDSLGTFYCWPDGFTRKYDISTYGQPFQDQEGKWWAPYPEVQVEATVKLCQEIVQRYPDIVDKRIVGHSDVAPGRKTDPGPAFDISEFRLKVFSSSKEETTLPDSAYGDDPAETALAERQQDRSEPEMSWIERVIARLSGIRH